jgi:YD repeat-containing protein
VSAAGETHITDYDYDAIGQLTRITRADGSYLDYGYNDARRLRTVTNNAGERITYDYDLAGNIVSQHITDGASNLRYQQTREFDELNRLLRIVNANGQTVERFGYDKNNNPTLSERGGDAATQFISTYDALDRLKTVTQPGGGLTTYG